MISSESRLRLHNWWVRTRGCAVCGSRPVVGEVIVKEKVKPVCEVHYLAWHRDVFAPLDRDYVA